MALKIKTFTDPALRVRCESVTLEAIQDMVAESGKLHEFIQEMREIALKLGGIGISAPQVGILERFFIMFEDNDKEKPIVVINPVVEEVSPVTVSSYEGCLSLPGVFGYVTRPMTVQTTFVNKDGLQEVKVFEGLSSTLFCHEYDHLNGVLFPSRGFNNKARRSLKKIHKLWVKPVEEQLLYA